jgi:hypothetical protein
MNAPSRADAFALWWVDRYTAALADVVAERRRAEIRSDLWEQRSAAAQAHTPSALVALSVTRRVVAGMAADLSWRRTQLAAARGRSPARIHRLWWSVRRTWWQALAALLGVIEVTTAASIPFEDGAKAGPAHVALLTASGFLVLSGLAQRRVHRRRGDVMIALGVLTVLDWYWTYVFPIAAATVIAAALIDAVDAQPTRHRATPTTGDRARDGLIVALAVALGVAALRGSPELGIVLVSTVLAALVAHAVMRRHRDRSAATRFGGFALGTGLGSVVFMVIAVTVSSVALRMPVAAVLAAMLVSGLGIVGGAILLVAGRRHSTRDAPMSSAVEPR